MLFKFKLHSHIILIFIVDEENKSHCPLCHRNFTPIGEDGWKHHLMSDANDSCKLNPRRQESLNRIG